MADPLLEVSALSKVYPRTGKRDALRALDGVSFRIGRAETLGLLGESGSGKTSLARILLRLEPPSAGRVTLDDLDWLSLPSGELRRARRRIQIVFQDASASLSSRRTAGASIAEPLRGCLGWSGARARARVRARVEEALVAVGLRPEDADRYPHEFSGGQRQRIAIARALAPEPELIVCDEPVSSLDVSVAGQILNLFREIQEQTGVSYLFISHDPTAVAAVAGRIAVLRFGRIVEEGPARELLARPQSAYTASLLDGIRA
jgi:ABC-type glutathione transport system ATPase component